MEKRVVGVFSPYNASEKTLCARYMTESIDNRYRRVFWIVPDDVPLKSRYSGFSYKWDTARPMYDLRKRRATDPREEIPTILSLASEQDQIKEKLQKCTMCVFFEESEALYSLLPKSASTAIFLDPYRWNPGTSRPFSQKCTYVLSSSPWVVKKVVERNLLFNNILCPFDPDIQLIPKAVLPTMNAATIFYPAYDMTFTERRCLQKIANTVKACCPDTKSVIGYYDPHETSEPGRDAHCYDWKLLDYIKQSDWIIDLNPRPLMGLFAALAGAMGIQWSCFKIPPNTDQYSAARRHLVPYPKKGLSDTKSIAEEIVRQLTAPFNGEYDRHKDAGSYISRINEFTRAMNKIFRSKNR